MCLWSRWIISGVLGWLFVGFSSKILSIVMLCVNAMVHWLPRITLAWVPGLNILWCGILIIAMGRLLNSDQASMVCKMLCEHMKTCPALLKWYLSCRSRCYLTCSGSKKIVYMCSSGDRYKVGYLVGTYRKDHRTWGEVAKRRRFCKQTTYLMKMDDIIHFDTFEAMVADDSCDLRADMSDGKEK